MQYLKSLLFLLLMATGVFAQSADTTETVPHFKNEGEHEEYRVKQLFKKEYKRQQYNRFSGKVSTSDNSTTQKRFSLWLFRKIMANPQVYYFELTNEKATGDTDIKEFIKGAQLTWFRPGGIII